MYKFGRLLARYWVFTYSILIISSSFTNASNLLRDDEINKSHTGPYFSLLPDEILIEIFGQKGNAKNTSTLCKHIEKLRHDPKFPLKLILPDQEAFRVALEHPYTYPHVAILSWSPSADDLPRFIQNHPKLSSLSLPYGTFSIDSLENATNLRSLTISGPTIDRIELVRSMKYLGSLNISGTKVSDLSPISQLLQLTSLDISFTNVSDLDPIKPLTNLQSLIAEQTPILDAQPIENLTNLCSLNFSQTQLNSCDAFAKMINLENIWLSHTHVTDIAPLHVLKKMKKLYLNSSQKIFDFLSLASLVGLEELYVGYTSFNHPDMLKKFRLLITLQVTQTPLADFSFLTDLPNLKIMFIDERQSAEPTLINQQAQLSNLTVNVDFGS